MVSKTALLNTFELPDTTSEAFFFTAKCAKKTQSTQRGYNATWSSSVSEIENAVWAATAHREADEREYHPLRWLAGMRAGGLEREPAYSKISYSKDSVWEEIL